jgi:hypothetical protein
VASFGSSLSLWWRSVLLCVVSVRCLCGGVRFGALRKIASSYMMWQCSCLLFLKNHNPEASCTSAYLIFAGIVLDTRTIGWIDLS